MKKRKALSIILLISSVAILGYVAYQKLPQIYYQLDQNKLDREFSSYKPKILKVIIPKRQLDKPMPTKLIIPKMKFDQSIVYASSNMDAQMKALKQGPTHYGGTALPGQIGNVIIGGHYVSYTFKYLNTLRVGDTATLSTPIADFKYKIIKTKVVNENALNEVKGYGKKKERLLTLYTCVYPSAITKARHLVVAKQIYP